MTDNQEIKEKDTAINELLLQVVKNQKQTNKALVKTFIIVVICYTIILVCMIFGSVYYESQFETKETVTTERTITQTVDGENSEINNIKGNMYKDNAVHNSGGE